MMRRRHGWQRPLHPLQLVGISIYSFLVVAFYCFLGLFLGSRIAEIILTSIFSFLAIGVMFLFIRCTAIDPTDKTSFKRNKKPKGDTLNYGFILAQIVMRFLTRIERRLLRKCVRRKYLLDPRQTTTAHMEPLLPFPLVIKDDAISPAPFEDDISFCSLCDFQVKKHSKHCRTCNRCVEGFDHHCRWLNNCIGRKNYRTFILLLIFVLLMLIIEGGTAIAIFIRCFADRLGTERELREKLYVEFPRGILAAISVLLVLLTAYGSAALGQLFFFHVVLIQKGMRTYDYILAMKEENQMMELELSEDSDFSSDESVDFDSPEPDKPSLISRIVCIDRKTDQNPQIAIRVDGESQASTLKKKQGFRASINPWKLIKMSREKALIAADRARERFMRQKSVVEDDPLKPLPLETKNGPLTSIDRNIVGSSSLTPLITKGRLSSPKRRFSLSPSVSGARPSPKHRYKSNFDLKLTEVSRELETYISRQVLCSVLKKGEAEASPR